MHTTIILNQDIGAVIANIHSKRSQIKVQVSLKIANAGDKEMMKLIGDKILELRSEITINKKNYTDLITKLNTNVQSI